MITHIKRLKNTEDFVPRFLSTIEPLARADKLGPVLFQLPPNMKADAEAAGGISCNSSARGSGGV